jgi:hypothetical protein
MSTYSLRCRNAACRHRRVSATHPDDYVRAPRCPACGGCHGWRIEQRAYNRRGLCHCDGPLGNHGPFPHRTSHPLCDQHPRGAYNQLRRAGVGDDAMPLELMGTPIAAADERVPF